jgi:hypothetical protein
MPIDNANMIELITGILIIALIPIFIMIMLTMLFYIIHKKYIQYKERMIVKK